MKSKEQIISYFNKYTPKSEIDRLAIIQYCADKKIKINFADEEGDKENVEFNDFKAWFDKECPQGNEVIILEEKVLLIVKEVTFDHIVAGAALTKDHKLITEETAYSYAVYEEACIDDKVRFQKALNDAGLIWNKKNKKLIDRIQPQNNQYIRISLLGSKIAIGVFCELNAEGIPVMYCVKEINKAVRYSLYESMDNLPKHYQIEPMSAQERDSLNEELRKTGKQWCGHGRRIEPIAYKMENGVLYYFINDEWDVQAKIAKQPKDRKRFNKLNYFLNREDAKEIAEMLHEARLKQLARNTKTKI